MYISYVPDDVSFVEAAAAAILSLRATSSSPGETYRGESTGPEAVYNFEGKAIYTHIDVSVSTAFEVVHRRSSAENGFVEQILFAGAFSVLVWSKGVFQALE